MSDPAVPQTIAARREHELWMAIKNLQDALYWVEWIRRAPDNQWVCAFCHGVSEEHGGDGHQEECQWQKLMCFGPKDVEEALSALPVLPQVQEEQVDTRQRSVKPPSNFSPPHPVESCGCDTCVTWRTFRTR